MLSPKAAGDVVLDHVSRRFGALTVLDDVSLSLAPGSITEIVGNNGVGKTSLLRILAGTLAPTSGSVTVAGMAPGRGMAALVPAGDRALYWRLTGRQELEFFARVTGVSRTEAQKVAGAASAALQVDQLMDGQIGTFSTGQRRRLMVARSLVGRAPVLLFDEPYADLDDTACEIVATVANGWADQGGVVVWTSPAADGGPPPHTRYVLADGMISYA